MISEEKKDAVRNLYLSGIGEEFIAMQVDLEIPVVINILKELGMYKSEKNQLQLQDSSTTANTFD